MFTILKLILITYVLSDLFKVIGEIISGIKSKYKLVNIIRLLLTYVLSCGKCSSFWFTLIYTQNLLYASLVAIVISIIKMLEEKYIKVKL